MNSLFPFGLPFPTAFYLVLYVLTFALHQAFMHYVLAGSFYIAWCNLFPVNDNTPNVGRIANPSYRTEQPLCRCLRDWMPFVLSAAITAGVAPLLFIQIVYPTAFYTANLLLSWRWMIVIPVLIVAFYLLYLVKSKRYAGWSSAVRTALAVVIACCFLFVGFCWTANHLISMDAAAWPAIYETGDVALSSVDVTLRVLIWSCGAVLSMAVFAGWQLSYKVTDDNSELIDLELHRLSRWSLGTILLGVIASAGYLIRLDGEARELILGSFALPYLIAASLGIILQAASWFQLPRTRTRRLWLTGATAGCLLSLVGVSVVREAIRLSHIDVTQLFENHASAREIGGFVVFLIFTVINFAVIGYCVWLVRRGLESSAEA